MRKTAILKFNSLSGSNVDREKGIVYGVQLAKLGKKATFKALDGKKTSIDITPKVVAGLLALFSAEEQITAHWTHGWIERGEDGLLSKTATFRNFRTAENGDLLADAFLWPNEHKEAILHAAENDPTGMMVSTVFDYTGGEKDAMPTRVHAADFVEAGAATTALCAKLSEDPSTENQTMPLDIAQLLAALQDPKVLDAFKAIIKSVESSQSDAEVSDTDATAIEADAGVTDADKKDDDKDKPALMRVYVRVARSIARQAKSLGTEKKAILAEAKTVAAAELTAQIGNGKLLALSGGKGAEGHPFVALMSKHLAVKNDRATAILRAKNDDPKAYNDWEAQGRPMPATV